jgi:hypothetical protein
VKKAKASHWDSFLQNAKGKDIFKALGYTEQRTTRAIPEFQYTQGGERNEAKEFEEQCNAFITKCSQALLAQIHVYSGTITSKARGTGKKS